MAVSTNMAICIAASICASAAIYFLLRSRMSVLENTVATLCRAVQDSSADQQRNVCMSIPQSVRTGAAIVNNIASHASLIPVSDDDNSSYITTSDEDDDDDEEETSSPLKTVTLTGGGVTSLGSNDLSSIISSISRAGQPRTNVKLSVKHISGDDNDTDDESNTDTDDESNTDEGYNANGEATEVAQSIEHETGETESDSLEGFDFTQYKVPELRAFVTKYQLAPNPTKLRKGELLDILIEAQSS